MFFGPYHITENDPCLGCTKDCDECGLADYQDDDEDFDDD